MEKVESIKIPSAEEKINVISNTSRDETTRKRKLVEMVGTPSADAEINRMPKIPKYVITYSDSRGEMYMVLEGKPYIVKGAIEMHENDILEPTFCTDRCFVREAKDMGYRIERESSNN